MTHEGTITLSVGKSRYEARWRPLDIQWSALIARMGEPTRTAETLAEYARWGKAEQDAKKDIGGYVGGALKGGRRTAANVAWRSLVNLDADTATPALLQGLGAQPYAWCLHSTRKHGLVPGQLRVRVLIPLKRPVSPDEYQAISRRLAADLGMEHFDDSTHEPHRLMYWPSVSQDSEYLHRFQDAAWVDPDEILARYHDWRDTTQWPVTPGRARQLKQQAARAGDPRAKPGLIGAFCRAYPIDVALDEFLSDVYVPGPGEGRYTYRGGSSSGGLVIYEGLWAYSHHGTDPSAGRLCNAWDLVRLHRHSDDDEGHSEDTPINKLPSSLAMAEWARGLAPVKTALLAERLHEARGEFGTAGGPRTPDTESVSGGNDDSWRVLLEFDRKGNLLTTRENYRIILTHDPRLAGRLCYNLFTAAPCIRGDVPWRDGGAEAEWADTDDSGVYHYLEHTYRVPPPVRSVADALALTRQDNAFHPVREYLLGLDWDGTPRLDRLLVDTLGAEDTPYIQAVGRKLAVSAVSRVMQPGCKADHVPMFIGPQGLGKSTLVAILGGPWASDSLDTVEGKDAYEQLRGTWIIELAELNPTRRADIEAVKHFISKPADRYREAYGHHVRNFPRQCVFVGSTNNWTPLLDRTGNRRFWPVAVRDTGRGVAEWVPRLIETRDQLWAEALFQWRMGEENYLTGDLAEQARLCQEDHRVDDGLQGLLQTWLDEPVPEDWYQRSLKQRQAFIKGSFPYEGETIRRDRACAREVWDECLSGSGAQFSNARAREINEVLRLLGWEECTTIRLGCYGRTRGFQRPEEAAYRDDDIPF